PFSSSMEGRSQIRRQQTMWGQNTGYFARLPREFEHPKGQDLTSQWSAVHHHVKRKVFKVIPSFGNKNCRQS
ncbi:hypothetical protein ACEQ6C_17775, partial [Rhizobium ruizarguesonis]